MMSVTPGPEKETRRVWPRVMLVISLGLNLLFVGLMLGAVARHGGPEGRRPPPSVGAALYRALPHEDRQELRKATRPIRDREQMRTRDEKDLEGIAQALRATPFDAATLSELVNRDFERRRDGLASMQAAWLQRIEEMSDQERDDYAERLMEVFAPPKHGWFKRFRD